MTEVTVRDARPDDAEAINQVALAAFAQYRDRYDDWPRFSRGLGAMSTLARTAALLVAERDGAVVGAVGYVAPHAPKPDFFEPARPVIRMLVVDPAARGAGAGRRLTEACVEMARRDGAPVIALHTSPIQSVALAMYLRMGFEHRYPVEPIFGVAYAVYVKPLT
ncbi:MAG: GNAT family N-acetyltransferase [Caulobacteraceae bacterium]|nr:GNAT family N-acetyltransferase [Caulobacteraceae bacterium]